MSRATTRSLSRLARPIVIGVAGVLLLTAAACSSDDDDTTAATTTVAEGPSTEQVRRWQTELQTVGCYHGEIDGEIGPETDEAILAFQRAEGLAVDDIVGPATESALTAAAEAGREVCAEEITTTTAAAGEPACTEEALITAMRASEQAAAVVSVDTFECSGAWAYAYADLGGGGGEPSGGTTTTAPEITVTVLFEAHDGKWQVVDRGGPCSGDEVPQDIRQAACESN